MRAIVAHKVSTVVVNTVGNLSAANIPAGSFGVVSTGNLNAMDILVGSLNAMDIRAGSSAAANIPAASTVGASMVNVEGMASIATERERQRYTLARSSPAAMPESRLGDFGLFVSASNRTLTRPMPRALAMARRLSRRADPCQYSKWRLRTDLRLGPADVMLQLLDHELPVADDALDQITDRDDADKLTTTDHRQVAHALGAHDCHAFLD